MVATNATNSAAIDAEGNIWVWGSGRYGLLGDHIKDVNYQVPKPLYLTTSGETEEEIQARDAFTRPDQLARYKVRDIAIGQYHMIVVAVDSEMHSQFTKLEYASDILAKLKDYLVDKVAYSAQAAAGVGAQAQVRDSDETSDRKSIELALKEKFSRDKYNWPYAQWSTLYDLFFEDLHLVFSEDLSMTLDKLKRDLAGSSDLKMINLKELRDQILGHRVNTNVVFGWGLNDERLCSRSSHSDKAPRRYMRQKVLGSLTNYQVVRVACGNSFSLALTQDGQVYAWGIGKSGSLGLGEISTIEQYPHVLSFQCKNDDSLLLLNQSSGEQANDLSGQAPQGSGIPVQNEKIVAIASGQTHCLALTERGDVYSWGNGQGGRLGHGDSIGQNVPEKIRYLESVKVIDIVCGDQHSGCITEAGQVYVWGVGLNGRLGVGTDINREVPTAVSEFNQDPCSRLFFGMNTSFAITKSSELYVWGSGQYGKMGLPNTSDMQILVPRKLFTLSTKRIAEFSAGPFHTMALTYDGFLYAFGNSKEGKLGIRLAEQQISMRIDEDDTEKILSSVVDLPTLLTNAPKFSVQGELQKVFKSYEKFQGFTSEGIVVDTDDTVKRLKVIQTACGDANSYFLTNTGVVYAAGANDRWQCSEIEEARASLELIPDEYLQPLRYSDKELVERGGVVIPEVAASIIRDVQRMQQLNKPYPVTILKKDLKQPLQIKHIAAGASHALAVSINGHCYGWGDNEYGQLGLGRLLQTSDSAFVEKPTLLKDLLDKKILMSAAGRHHTLFLTELGQVFSAGFNEFGQLGIPSKGVPLKRVASQEEQFGGFLSHWIYQMTKSTPQRVELENIRFVACGDDHSLAISDSSNDSSQQSHLYSWGWGAFGQLGHSKIKNSYNLDRPKKVKFREAPEGDTRVAFVAAGSKHTICIDLEGKLWYFGSKLSVGIREPTSKLQYEPAQLKPANRNDFPKSEHGFVYVSASRESNLVIAASDNQVYYVGQRNAFRSKEEALADEYQSDDEEADERVSDGGNIDAGFNKVHQTLFKKISRPDGTDFQACHVSLGPEHHLALENIKTVPYSWGANESGQLGLGPTKRKKHKTSHVTGISTFLEMIESQEANQLQFQQIMQRAAAVANGRGGAMAQIQTGPNSKTGKKSQLKAQDYIQSSLRYPIQTDLKKQYMGVPSTVELLKADIKIQKQFNKLAASFHQTCKGIQQGQQTMVARAQDGLITRIEKFPTPIDQHLEMQSSIPKSITRNRQIYEAIFTYLQSHPCYLINWIKGSKFFDEPEDLELLLCAIFGKREMRDNQRALNTLMLIAKAVFDAEAKLNNFKQLCSVYRTESPFRTIFRLIFEAQTSNQGFIKAIISRMLYKLQKVYQRIATDEEIVYNQAVESEMLTEIFLFTLDVIRKRIDLLGGIDLTKSRELKDQSHLTLQVLSLLDYAYRRLTELSETGQGSKGEVKGTQAGGQDASNKADQALSDDSSEEGNQSPIKPLGDKAKAQEEFKATPASQLPGQAASPLDQANVEALGAGEPKTDLRQNEKIFPYLLDLLFESLVRTLQTLTYEQIVFEYWDYTMTQGEEPLYDVFGPADGSSGSETYLVKLCKHLKMYFRGQAGDAPHASFQEILTTGQVKFRSNKQMGIRSLCGTNYREEIAKSLFLQSNYKPYELEFVLVQQLFETCTETADPVLSVTVSDIVYVFNSLVQNAAMIFLYQENDPVRYLTHDLGAAQIHLNLPKESLRMRLNLHLQCRFLTEHSQIIKCKECHAPLTDKMLPTTLFQDSFYGRSWQCTNKACLKHNTAGTALCGSCHLPMGATAAGSQAAIGDNLVFQRYHIVQMAMNVKLFKFALKNLPMIEDSQDVLSLIETELSKIVFDKQSEVQKHEKLTRFKQMILDHTKKQGRSGTVMNYLNLLGYSGTDDLPKKNSKLQLMLAEKDFLDGLAVKLEEQARLKMKHQRLLKDYQAQLAKINLLTPVLKQRAVLLCQSLDQVLYNAYTGVGSHFLKEQIDKRGGNFKQIERAMANESSAVKRLGSSSGSSSANKKMKERVWAGSLHIDPKDLGSKKQLSESRRSVNAEVFGETQRHRYKKKTKAAIMTEFFAEISTGKALAIDHGQVTGQEEAADREQKLGGQDGGRVVGQGDESVAEGVCKQLLVQACGGAAMLGKERAITGTVKYTTMQRDRVIKSADNSRYDHEILKNSQFHFSDNGKYGFLVELVYKEPRSMSMHNLKMDQVVLENFEIKREILCEMRRNFACHSAINFGMVHFRVHELVTCLNRIIAMNNVFSSLSLDENGYRLKRDPGASQQQADADKLNQGKPSVGGGPQGPLSLLQDNESDIEEQGDTRQAKDKKKSSGSGKRSKSNKKHKSKKAATKHS